MPVYMDQIAVIPLRSMQLEIESDDEGGAAVDDDEPYDSSVTINRAYTFADL